MYLKKCKYLNKNNDLKRKLYIKFDFSFLFHFNQ